MLLYTTLSDMSNHVQTLRHGCHPELRRGTPLPGKSAAAPRRARGDKTCADRTCLSNVCSIIIAAMAAAARYAELHAGRTSRSSKSRTPKSWWKRRGCRAGRHGADRSRRPLRRRAIAKAAQGRTLPAICGVELTIETAGMKPIRPSRPRGRRTKCPRSRRGSCCSHENARGYRISGELISLTTARAQARFNVRSSTTQRPYRGSGALSGGGKRPHRTRAARTRRRDAVRNRRTVARSVSRSFYLECSITYGPRTARSCRRSCISRSASVCPMSRRTRGVRSTVRMPVVRCAGVREVQVDACDGRHAAAANAEYGLKTPEQMARLFRCYRWQLQTPWRSPNAARSGSNGSPDSFRTFRSRTKKTNRAIIVSAHAGPQTAHANAMAGHGRRRSRRSLKPSSASSSGWGLSGYFLVVWTSRARRVK